MTLDLDAIESTARKATVGPWSVYARDAFTARYVMSDMGSICALSDYEHRPDERDNDADHIAQCSPDVVLALVAKLRAQEAAIRFLWDAWSEAEGDGQPRVYVFGDAEMDAWLKEQGETHRERASEEVQAVIREVVGR